MAESVRDAMQEPMTARPPAGGVVNSDRLCLAQSPHATTCRRESNDGGQKNHSASARVNLTGFALQM